MANREDGRMTYCVADLRGLLHWGKTRLEAFLKAAQANRAYA